MLVASVHDVRHLATMLRALSFESVCKASNTVQESHNVSSNSVPLSPYQRRD